MIDNSAAAKTALDDESFTRLLEAAYILQQHQGPAVQRVAPEEFPHIVNSILEIQRQTQSLELDLSSALKLIATRLCEFTGAAGASIGRVEKEKMHYLIGAGSAAVLTESSISVDATSSGQCVRSGKSIKSLATEADSRINLVLCRKLGAKSFLAVPVFRNGEVDAVVELFFSTMNAFGELEIRVAELMAGVVGEVLTQQAEHELKHELATERATVLSVLEQLKPQLQKLAGEEAKVQEAPTPKVDTELCRACGQPMESQEHSCPNCGALRKTGKYPGTELQSKWAALWERQAMDVEHVPSFRRPAPHASTDDDLSDSVELDGDSEFEESESLAGREQKKPNALVLHRFPDLEDSSEPEAEEAEAQHPTASSLTVAGPSKGWKARILPIVQTRRGDVSLLIAALVFAFAAVWGLWSKPVSGTARASTSVAAAKHKFRPKPPQLSLYEKALISLGLAVPPPAPEYLGDPDVKVWVDLQTGLYYCPGAGLYGSTPKGRYNSQWEAQQDSFEPAARVPCD